jgi:hypothetical protein
MANMLGVAFKDFYKRMLQLAGASSAGFTTTLAAVEDGTGTTCPLQLATDKVNIASGFQLGGVAVTATAAQLNAAGAPPSNMMTTDTAQTATAAKRGAYVTLSDQATITIDMALGNNFKVTLAGSRQVGAPTNMVAGQWGTIKVIQDASGGRTLSWNAAFKWAGGSAPVLTTTAGGVDHIGFLVEDDGSTITAWLGVKGRA